MNVLRSCVPIEIVSKVILRHANLATTRRCLGKVSDVEAIRRIEKIHRGMEVRGRHALFRPTAHLDGLRLGEKMERIPNLDIPLRYGKIET